MLIPKHKNLVRNISIAILLVVFTSMGHGSHIIYAATLDGMMPLEDKINFKNGGGYYSTASQACSPSGSAMQIGNGKDIHGNQIFTNEELEKVKKFQPFYMKASQEVGVPWQMLAVIHFRESNFSAQNPAAPSPSSSPYPYQGIYQDYKYTRNGGKPYPPGPVTDAEFQRQTTNAAEHLAEKSKNRDALRNGNIGEVKYTFLGYNGRASVYKTQAAKLGFTEHADGSPYVMNYASEKQNPEDNPTGWGQIKLDGGSIVYPANSIYRSGKGSAVVNRNNYGAFVLYSALLGGDGLNSDIQNISLIAGACGSYGTGSAGVPGALGWDVEGPNAMKVYYQYKMSPDGTDYSKLPFAYRPGKTIQDGGCGPTSVAMVISTLTGKAGITPKTVGDYALSNGHTYSGGSTWSLFGNNSLFRDNGLVSTELGTDMSKVESALKRGSLIIMSQDPGIFTSGGHILVIRAMTDDGRYLVADPYSDQRTMNKNSLSSNTWGGYTSYEISGRGTPSYSSGNTKKISGSLKGMWEISRRDGGSLNL